MLKKFSRNVESLVLKVQLQNMQLMLHDYVSYASCNTKVRQIMLFEM